MANKERIIKQRVNIDFPIGLLRKIDADCRQIGVTRQAWIKIACDERLRATEQNRKITSKVK
ncbi:MAG: CopG family transcriptional regulator [Acidobacteria bacterium]|nr:MAG: CopG family transcriptional regulator [Acidobacteriota bacterium]